MELGILTRLGNLRVGDRFIIRCGGGDLSKLYSTIAAIRARASRLGFELNITEHNRHERSVTRIK